MNASIILNSHRRATPFKLKAGDGSGSKWATHLIALLLKFRVEDHRLFREGLKAMLLPGPEYEIIGEAEDGLEAIRLIRKHKPDLVLLDLHNAAALTAFAFEHGLISTKPRGAIKFSNRRARCAKQREPA